MNDELLQVTREGRVAVLTLNRPHVRNALNAALVEAIASAAAALDRDESVGVLLLRAGGPSFCSGIDLKEALPTRFEDLYFGGLGDREALARVRKPVVGAVKGAAMGGGCELALMCDLLIADSTARLSLPEVKRGGIPGVGGTQRLARRVGRMRALELTLTGRVVDAAEALALGLVLEVVAPELLDTRTLALAQEIAAVSPLAAAMIKQSIAAADETGLAGGLQLERALCYGSIVARTPPR